MDSEVISKVKLRRNPPRIFDRPSEDSVGLTLVSCDKNDVLDTKENTLLQKLKLESYRQCSTKNNVDNPLTTNSSPSPKPTSKNECTNEHVPKKEPQGLNPCENNITKLKPGRGRKPKNVHPSKKKTTACKSSPDGLDKSSRKRKKTCLRQTKRSQNQPKTTTEVAHANTTLFTQQTEILHCHSNGQLTPKKTGLQNSPLLCSTPKPDLQTSSPKRTRVNGRKPSLVKSSFSGDLTPRPLKTRKQSKLKTQRSPSTSPGVKRQRKSPLLPVESLQEKLLEETLSQSEITSSDLSIELSWQEEPLPLSLQEEDDETLEEDDEELPSFLWQEHKQPSSFSKGQFVWCKYRKYPYWPAVVTSVKHKSKKASVVFVDSNLNEQKRSIRGISVSLRNLKHFDCEEAKSLVELAKEKYDSAITWSLDLISDYRIRIGCGSFSGSFIDYFMADISCPVRRKFSEGTTMLTFPTQEILAEQSDISGNPPEDMDEEKNNRVVSKRLLPDRTKAARTRANKKLVDFIIGRKVECHLQGIISGQKASKWMQALQSSHHSISPVFYLENDQQVEMVYKYLVKVCESCASQNSCRETLQMDRVRLVLDVLLPEAIVYAIAGVNKLSLEKAEEKYLRGPCFSNRERQEFDMMIERQMRIKEIEQAQNQ